MKKFFNLLLIVAFVPLLLTTGCKKDIVDAEFDTLSEYVTTNTLDLPDILKGWVLPGSKIGVDTNDFSVPNYYVMDFRKADDFSKGHIKGAHNVVFAKLLEEAAKTGGKDILCVCYTGQTAARATGFLRLAGYHAVTLKWGMAGWNADFDAKWSNNAKDVTSSNWVETGAPQAISEFDLPDFTADKTEGKDILTARINKAIGFEWTVSNTDVLANPDNYFINNFWPQDSWDTYGHIKGAYRISDLKIETLKNLNPKETVVTYCYTGQTSAITTAWLQVMGFDNAKSLLFGANGMAHSKLVVGTVSKAAAKSWHGEGSASTLNFGYVK